MKFKAILTDRGILVLEKGFVPAFEKIGKTCYMYLTKEHVTLLHNAVGSDGIQAIAQFKQSLLFDEYQIVSQNEDRIAFTVDLHLFLRALKSSISMDGDRLQVKLVKKRPSVNERPMPFLTLESKGFRSAVVQDVPISLPLARNDVQDLQAALDTVQALPRTMVQMPELSLIQGLVDRLKNVSDALTVAVTSHGDLHLQVAASLASVGSEFRNLQILGTRASNGPLEPAASPSVRLEQALQRDEASSVQVKMKHLVKSLQYILTKPDASFVGVAPNDAYLLLMFQYYVPGTRQADNAMTLHCRLPVMDQAVGQS